MGEQFLFDYFGIPVVLWMILYTSDYYLTIWGAYLYTHGAKAHWDVEGSYELNPLYEKDIDLRILLSPRFLIYLAGSTLVLLIVRGLARDLPALFLLLAGGLILLEAFVHFRHIRNLVSLWHLRQGIGMAGRIEYRRWYTYRSSSIEGLVYAVFFGLVAALGGSWFFAGGALSCLGIFIRHGLRANRLQKAAATGTLSPSPLTPLPRGEGNNAD